MAWTRQLGAGLRRVSDRTSLRAKLVASLLALVIVALVVISCIGIFQLRNYLVGRADQQIQQAYGKLVPSSSIQRGTWSSSQELQIATNMIAEAFDTSGNVYSVGPSILDPRQPSYVLPLTPSWLAANTGSYVTVRAGGTRWRTYVGTVTTLDGSATYYVVVASDLTDVYRTIGELTVIDVIVSAAVLLVLAIVGFAVVQANLRPLVDIEETAGEIAEGHLNRRVRERDPRTEIGSLGHSLNVMLSQIESAFHAREESEAAAHRSEERMRRFVADASHELRTPLTTIRGFAEYYRQRGGTAQEWDQDGLSAEDLNRIMHRVEAEAARMGLLVEDLLMLARMDQQRPLARNPVDLLVLTADAVQDARMLAPDRSIGLSVQRGAAFLVNGDEARLRQVIGNLMSNALTHTPEGTPIEVSIASGTLRDRSTAQAVVLTVTDHGPGMTKEQAERAFERFYRVDAARTRAKGGSGLGLAIVSALVDAHGGEVSLRTGPGEGASFRVALPLAPEAVGEDDSDDADEPADSAGPSAGRESGAGSFA